ncbi:protein ANKUB1-like [Cheilinus undulatus]|uniref:protein ANKUB1-like n=1 Tax=Cheilinus undulatus TaxID=241271 RepID=UPI001BD680FD|nr:protein ANKUB1-like [Cheilinus undulatus]
MRVFICFEGYCEPFDVPADQTVGAMKHMIKEHFLVHFSDDKQVHQYLELSYGGAALQDTWALCDVGIRSGSALRCLIKSEQRPAMHVFNAVSGETLPIMGSEALLQMSVGRLKTVLSMQSGLPVSVFRLSTAANVQLYDCNQLRDYGIEVGSILRLDTWDGWVEFLRGCLLGHRPKVQSHLSDNKPVMRFQLQVALYIAACLGHLDLTGWLLESGVHGDEPVGVHPYRLWCHQTAHRDTRKCPIHMAAERNQLLVLKLFISRNPLTLACRDPEGRDLLKVALQQGHTDCVRYLASKLFSVVSLPGMSLPMRIYLQMKRWASLGQKRAASNRCQHISVAFKARMGNKLLVDGFNQPIMSSKCRKSVTKQSRGIKAKELQPLPLHIISKRTPPRLSSLLSVNPKSEDMHKEMQHDLKKGKGGLLEKVGDEDSISCRSRFLLPPVTQKSITMPLFDGASPKPSHFLTASLESFPSHCGRTPRENAIHCFITASAFTEKPWLKQLKIAQTLIKKRAHMA